jgi:hypothetical protein
MTSYKKRSTSVNVEQDIRIPLLGQFYSPQRCFNGIWKPLCFVQRVVSSRAGDCFGILCRYAGAGFAVRATRKKLCAELGCKPRMLYNYLKELEINQFIRISRSGENGVNTYKFLWNKALEEDLRSTPRTDPSQLAVVPVPAAAPTVQEPVTPAPCTFAILSINPTFILMIPVIPGPVAPMANLGGGRPDTRSLRTRPSRAVAVDPLMAQARRLTQIPFFKSSKVAYAEITGQFQRFELDDKTAKELVDYILYEVHPPSYKGPHIIGEAVASLKARQAAPAIPTKPKTIYEMHPSPLGSACPRCVDQGLARDGERSILCSCSKGRAKAAKGWNPSWEKYPELAEAYREAFEAEGIPVGSVERKPPEREREATVGVRKEG